MKPATSVTSASSAPISSSVRYSPVAGSPTWISAPPSAPKLMPPRTASWLSTSQAAKPGLLADQLERAVADVEQVGVVQLGVGAVETDQQMVRPAAVVGR